MLRGILAALIALPCAGAALAADLSSATLVEKGSLTYGVAASFAPFEFQKDSKPVGFDIDMIEALSKKLGAEAKPMNMDFQGLIPALQSGRIDIINSAMYINPKRAEQVDFSSPYYTADQAVVALNDSDYADAASLEDLKGATFGVQIGTTSLDAVNEVIQPDNDPRVFQNSNDVVSALKQRQVDAVVVDTPTALYLTAAQVPDGTIVGEFPAPGGDEWGALLAKDSSLTGCVSAAVDELKSSGELDKIQQQWINSAGGVKELQ